MYYIEFITTIDASMAFAEEALLAGGEDAGEHSWEDFTSTIDKSDAICAKNILWEFEYWLLTTQYVKLDAA